MDETNEPTRKVHERLKVAREYAGLSQGQVARLLGMHRPTVSEIEKGRRKVSSQELVRFAKIYDVEASWLIASEPCDAGLFDERVQLAARNLARLRPDDLDRVIALLQAIQKPEK